MANYTITVTFEADSASEAVQRFSRALYVEDIDAKDMKLSEENSKGDQFRFPFTRDLLEAAKKGGDRSWE